MTQQVISYADLSVINNALRSISSDMKGIHSELGDMNVKQDQLEDELIKLAASFASFVEEDLKHKALQLAETRQGNLKQDLQIKFGFYAEVRRMATGILQGIDTGIISDDTLKLTTEEVMIKAPGYWLAPALVALASWIRNDRSNTGKAVAEGLKRNDYKTTLFFLLVMRRLNRNAASMEWLERYFRHQNPHDLDREFIIILEAVAAGAFPPASRQLMMNNIKSWLEQLTSNDNYINEQKTQWLEFFKAKGPLYDGQYPLLEKFSTNWDDLKSSIRELKTHRPLLAHFKDIFASNDSSIGIKTQLDEILSLLVINFDDEELPLQQQIRLNQLIIEMNGDKSAAQAMMDAEKHIFDEKVDFLQMLTNAAFNPNLSGATKSSQILAISISQPWIVEAHDTFTADGRNSTPGVIELNIDGFQTSTPDGSDEESQLQKHEVYWTSILEAELRILSFPYGGLVIGILLFLFGIWAFSMIGLLALSVGIVIGWICVANYRTAKKKIIENVAQRNTKSREVLRGCIAETVDYRRECALEDNMAEELHSFLTSVKPEDFSSISKDTKSILQAS